MVTRAGQGHAPERRCVPRVRAPVLRRAAKRARRRGFCAVARLFPAGTGLPPQPPSQCYTPLLHALCPDLCAECALHSLCTDHALTMYCLLCTVEPRAARPVALALVVAAARAAAGARQRRGQPGRARFPRRARRRARRRASRHLAAALPACLLVTARWCARRGAARAARLLLPHATGPHARTALARCRRVRRRVALDAGADVFVRPCRAARCAATPRACVVEAAAPCAR